jgi:hypothetical protein
LQIEIEIYFDSIQGFLLLLDVLPQYLLHPIKDLEAGSNIISIIPISATKALDSVISSTDTVTRSLTPIPHTLTPIP